jgi:hypothetical protein
MALTLVSTTARERLLRHVRTLTEAEARDALALLVARRERAMAERLGARAPSRMLRRDDGEHAHGQALDSGRREPGEAMGALADDRR